MPVDTNATITARARARFGDYAFDHARADADRRRSQCEALAFAGVHPAFSADWKRRQRAVEVMRLSAAIDARLKVFGGE